MATNHNKGQGVEGLQSFTSEQIEIAKSFIWEHLDEKTKEFILYVSSMSEGDRNKLYVKKIFCRLEGELKEGLITNEIAVLTADLC